MPDTMLLFAHMYIERIACGVQMRDILKVHHSFHLSWVSFYPLENADRFIYQMWLCRVQQQSTSEGNSVKCNFPTLDFTEIAWHLNMYENVQKCLLLATPRLRHNSKLLSRLLPCLSCISPGKL